MYPSYVFLLSFVILTCAHRLKKYNIRNYFIIFFWPLLFCTYLHYFVQAIVDAELVQHTYASPYYMKLSGDSYIFFTS